MDQSGVHKMSQQLPEIVYGAAMGNVSRSHLGEGRSYQIHNQS